MYSMKGHWVLKAQESKEDLDTKILREDIKISLTDREYVNLKMLAYKVWFRNPGDLLSSFVSDLTGWHRNGSDENDLAEKWFERTFGESEDHSNFIHYLYNNDFTLGDMAELLKDEDYYQDVYESYIYENRRKKNQTKEECKKLMIELLEKGEEL
ncbi:hypothetical protein [Desulfitobacterium chlororespirans]|uniref:Uncharacterized protein n=1 Tax=Desulfitobacterium chlororespirans DSM 11544 TaxID=1121395 RepID=A0A1M7UYE1_9FIRM|nr:hypothetical protein [Desulfitobacterium chlororespirans]SHN87988.1 hypothetical protein SAMN02745215_05069 [Desulfitobacterium chlororespirans DSM 11544]